jgi:hypothetical protein
VLAELHRLLAMVEKGDGPGTDPDEVIDLLTR